MTLFNKIPASFKQPTAWVALVMFVGFIYAQWPSKEPVSQIPTYYQQELLPGFSVRWEAEPDQQQQNKPEVWVLDYKRMTFLVQTDVLTIDFTAMVTAIAEQDRALVGGAVQEPMVITEGFASYAFFDAESRIQSHRWYVHQGQWVKISILYKPSNETRVLRAAEFFSMVDRKN